MAHKPTPGLDVALLVGIEQAHGERFSHPKRAWLPRVLGSRGAADAEGVVKTLAERGLFARAARCYASHGVGANQGRAGLSIAWGNRGGLVSQDHFHCVWPHAPGRPGRAVAVRWFAEQGCAQPCVQRTRLRRAPTSAEFRPKIMRQRWRLDGDAAPLTPSLGRGGAC